MGAQIYSWRVSLKTMTAPCLWRVAMASRRLWRSWPAQLSTLADPCTATGGMLIASAQVSSKAGLSLADILASLGAKVRPGQPERVDQTGYDAAGHFAAQTALRCAGKVPWQQTRSGRMAFAVIWPYCDEPAVSGRRIQAGHDGSGNPHRPRQAPRLKNGRTRHSDLLTIPTFFARMLKGGAGYSQVHAADDEAPVFNQKTWHRANPSLKHLPSLMKRIRSEAKDAKMDADAMASFRALRLNMGTSEIVESMLLDPDLWASIQLPPKSKFPLTKDRIYSRHRPRADFGVQQRRRDTGLRLALLVPSLSCRVPPAW